MFVSNGGKLRHFSLLETFERLTKYNFVWNNILNLLNFVLILSTKVQGYRYYQTVLLFGWIWRFWVRFSFLGFQTLYLLLKYFRGRSNFLNFQKHFHLRIQLFSDRLADLKISLSHGKVVSWVTGLCGVVACRFRWDWSKLCVELA